MKKMLSAIAVALISLLCFVACNSSGNTTITTDPQTIANGEILFNKNCIGCHNFKQDNIGPKLGGVTLKEPADWIASFIKNPQQVISSGDKHATELFKKYKVAMPAFAALSSEDVQALVAFLNTRKQPEPAPKDAPGNLTNPITEPIKFDGLVAGITAFTQLPPSGDSGKQPLTKINELSTQPGSKNMFVLDQRGNLYNLQNGKPVVYLNMAKHRPAFTTEGGLGVGFGSFAFHPAFAKNGLFYTAHTEAAGTAKADFTYADSIKVYLQWVITEWKATNPAAPVFAGTSRELLRINFVSPIHGVQQIGFNPFATPGTDDYGMLYLGVGEGGAVENGYPFLAHSIQKVWGTLLRINPAGSNSNNGKYGIPPTNPFANNTAANTVKEIYAYGFRNPHRFIFTNQHQLLLANVGHGNLESLYQVQKGADYGWPIREGSFVVNPLASLNKVYALPANDSNNHINYPIAEYDHDEGKAISGGFIYSGTNKALQGKYLFGDIPTGRLFYINMADIHPGKQALVHEWKIKVNGTQKTLADLSGKTGRVDLHFGQDAAGNIYLLTKADGKIWKLE